MVVRWCRRRSCGIPATCRNIIAMQTRRAKRAASRAGNQRVDHVACLDEGDVVLPGRGVDVGHWADERTSIDTTCLYRQRTVPSPRSPTLAPMLGLPSSRPAPPARWMVRPSETEPRRGCPGASTQPPIDAAPIAGREAHCQWQPRARHAATWALRGKAVGGRGSGYARACLAAPSRPPMVAADQASGSARGLALLLGTLLG